jgi:hypothetical protein
VGSSLAPRVPFDLVVGADILYDDRASGGRTG